MRPIIPELDSFSPQLPVIAGALDFAPEAGVAEVRVTVPCAFPNSAAALPMTGYMRILQWPPVGPLRVAGYPPVTATMPVELPKSDMGALGTVPVVMPFDPMAAVVDTEPWPALAIPLREVAATGGKNVWLALPTVHRDYLRAMPVLEASSTRAILAGVTRDSAGAPLPSCVVKAALTAELTVPIPPDVGVSAIKAETTSDSVTGAYSMDVRIDSQYQLFAYKVGSPDVAGITRNDVRPSYA